MMKTKMLLGCVVAGLFMVSEGAYALGNGRFGGLGNGNGLEDGSKFGLGGKRGGGNNRNNGNQKDSFVPGSNGSLAWVSWSEAQESMKNEKKALLLYVFDPKPTEKEKMDEKRYEVNLFKNAMVKEAAAKVVCVMASKGTADLPKGVRGDVGCWLVSYQNTTFIGYRRPPTTGKLAGDIQFAAAACAQAAAQEKRKAEEAKKLAKKKEEAAKKLAEKKEKEEKEENAK